MRGVLGLVLSFCAGDQIGTRHPLVLCTSVHLYAKSPQPQTLQNL